MAGEKKVSISLGSPTKYVKSYAGIAYDNLGDLVEKVADILVDAYADGYEGRKLGDYERKIAAFNAALIAALKAAYTDGQLVGAAVEGKGWLA